MIGTHNSMSYLPPKKWWLKPFRFIAQCQTKTIREQFEKYGVRLFDLRISYDKNGIPEFRHGLMAFKSDVLGTLRYLDEREVPIYVRLTLETNGQEDLFIRDCKLWETGFPNLIFFNGTRKSDWKRIFTFKIKDLPLTQLVGSMSGRKINGLWPRLYAELHNRENITVNRNTPYCLVDFIEIQ